MEQITDIVQIKPKVLERIAHYTYTGTLNEKLDKIPFEIIPGIKPNFRCCVYKEREIIRQRVRLGMGKLPYGAEYSKAVPTQILHVIPCACEGCPITRFTVTSNCQNCLTRKCMKVCKFGAISQTGRGAYIDKDKCKKCGQCVTACPYNAIVDTERPCKKNCPVDAIDMDSNDLAIIDTDKCINCGACMTSCPFGAISDISMMVNVINDIVEGKNVYAMLAPSIEGQFGDANIGMIKSAVKELGFKDVYEVAQGADVVAYEEADELIKHHKEGKAMTTSCCPGFVNLIDKNFPMLKEYVSPIDSPMIVTAKGIKDADENAVTIFIGPCLTKKHEMLSSHADVVDGVLTFEELQAMMNAKLVSVDAAESSADEASTFGKGFAKSGGVANAVLKAAKEQGFEEEITINIANGVEECKKVLALLKAGRVKENIIEGMACKGGCLNGPAAITDIRSCQKIFDKYSDNGNSKITDVVSSWKQQTKKEDS